MGLMRHFAKAGLNNLLAASALGPAAMTFAAPASACRTNAPLHIEDVRFADLVVVGRISHYRIVRDLQFRRKMLASPHLRPEDRKYYAADSVLLPDYARFEMIVDEMLAGKAPRRIAVTWDNSTFGEPETMAAGPFLIAFRRPTSAMPPLRGPSATIRGNREPGLLTLLQAPCSSPFLFESNSDQARTITRMLIAHPR
jgi:hypothetical protein